MNLRIRPFRPDDEPAALALEARCVQGNRLALRFERPSFAARSGQYKRSSILAAETESSKLVGITAWAAKPALLRGELFATAVHYDLRVDPAARGRGVAQALMGAALEDADPFAEGHYSLAAGQNVPVIRAIERFGRPYSMHELDYICLPISRFGSHNHPGRVDPARVRETCLERHQVELLFDGRPEDSAGYVTSIATPSGAGFVSIWNGESVMAERIVRLPRTWHAAAIFSRCVPWLPSIPLPGELVRAWYLYDPVVPDLPEARALVTAAKAAARRSGRTMLCVLLHADDERIDRLACAAWPVFRLPYRLLFTGRRVPGPHDRMQIDPRDL